MEYDTNAIVTQLKELFSWLAERDLTSDEITHRPAPSIVARSECELFTISYPRFAERVYLPEPCSPGFVNLRRLERFASMLEASYPTLASTVAESIKRGSTVADCLLPPPQRFAKEYEFLQVDLSAAYGEYDRFAAVPFLQHLRYTGGMCVQACAFMASALFANDLSSDIVHKVFGLAELTCNGPGDFTKGMHSCFDTGGKGAADLQEIFRDQPLSVAIDYVHENEYRNPIDVQHKLFGSCLRGYVESGFPVIAWVSLSRMWGDHVNSLYAEAYSASADVPRQTAIIIAAQGKRQYWDRQGITARNYIAHDQARESAYIFKPQPHAVLITGWHKTDPDKFMINDPATLPFLECSADDLWLARNYLRVDQEFNKPGASLSPWLMVTPFLPKNVRGSLLKKETRSSGINANRELGLLEFSMRSIIGFALHVGPPITFSAFATSKFLLCVNAQQEHQNAPALRTRTGRFSMESESTPRELWKRLHIGHWYWLQFLVHTGKKYCIVWDAEQIIEEQLLRQRSALQIAILNQTRDGRWQLVGEEM